MTTDIKGSVSMLDRETKEQIGAAGERLYGRLRRRVTGRNVLVEHAAPTGATMCEVSVSTTNRFLIFARHRNLDALKAALIALERARLQVGRALRTSRKSRLQGLRTATT